MILERAFRAVGILAFSLPVFAQYAGPAILSRGEAPAAIAGDEVSFRPYFELAGVYNTGLLGIIVNSQGVAQSGAAYGLELAAGVSGAHSWRHTKIALDYQFGAIHYNQASYYDGINQSLLLAVTHQFTRHTSLTLRENAGEFSGYYGFPGITSTVPFDPTTSFVPATPFFDNRVIYAATQADFILQKTARLSFDLGGEGFLARLRSTALYGTTGAGAHADVQYRLTRRTTVGAAYMYDHFGFERVFSSTDVHSVVGTYSTALTQHLEFSVYGGMMRYETKFVQTVPVDPSITALFGITLGNEVTYSLGYSPTVNARLAKTYKQGVAYISGGRMVIPGNGLFLTSTMNMGMVGYTYTGLRRWSMDANFSYSEGTSLAGLLGQYSDTVGTISISRKIKKSFHAIASFSASKYGSPGYSYYNQVFYMARIGIGWTPGDVPLRVW